MAHSKTSISVPKSRPQDCMTPRTSPRFVEGPRVGGHPPEGFGTQEDSSRIQPGRFGIRALCCDEPISRLRSTRWRYVQRAVSWEGDAPDLHDAPRRKSLPRGRRHSGGSIRFAAVCPAEVKSNRSLWSGVQSACGLRSPGERFLKPNASLKMASSPVQQISGNKYTAKKRSKQEDLCWWENPGHRAISRKGDRLCILSRLLQDG